MKPIPVGAIRIGSGNVDSGNPEPQQAVKLATNTQAYSWGWQEGKNLVSKGHLRNLINHRALTASGMGFQIPDDANDCPMLVRQDLNVVHFSMTKACDAITDSKVAHARTFSIIGYDVPRWDKPFFHVNIHPNWIQGVDEGRIVDEFIESMEVLKRLMLFVSDLTPYYALSGDFNITLGESRTRKHATPYSIAKIFSMSGRSKRLDAIYWSEDLKLATKTLHTIPKRITKSDHPYWLVADLKRK